MKKVFATLALVVISAMAFVLSSPRIGLSGNTEITNLSNLGMPVELASQIDKQYSSALTSSEIPNTNNAIDLGSSTKAFRNEYIGTNSVYTSAGGGPALLAPAPVVTISTTYPTPNATDVLTSRLTLIATAAPTASFVELPKATTLVGITDRSVYNQGASPLAIVPESGDSVNLVAAGTPFSCATGKLCTCRNTTIAASAQYICVAQ